MKNQEVAELLFEIADLLDLKGIEFKPRAYRKAAMNIQSLAEDVEKIYKKGGIKALEKIPGIGKSIAEKIAEYLDTGKLKYYEDLKKEMPIDVESLMNVPGLGPKRIKILYKKLGVKNISDLEKAAKKGLIRKLQGFDVKLEEEILHGIELAKKQKRMLLGYAIPLAEELVSELKKLKEVKRIVVAGSFRRRKETVGDLDILIISDNPMPVMEKFCSLPQAKEVIAKGKTKSVIRLYENNLEVDLRVVAERSFGSALQYFTGSKAHNIKLRQIAIKKGYKLSEYGLFRKKDGKYVAGKSEEEIYAKLGLQFVPPEMREDRGEIELALKRKLPKIVEEKDFKGDLHMHSKWSDGVNKIEELVKRGLEFGYKYIAISDHSKGLAIARGLNEKRLKQQIKEINLLQEKYPKIRIFKSLETNILPSGKIDMPNSALKDLDFVIAGVHWKFKQSKEEMTKRIMKAMENPYVRIISHPTGRIINERDAYEVDVEMLLEHSKNTGCFLEIDAFPNRLDLNDVNVKKAVELGLKLSIGSDSHNIAHMRYAKLGVYVARRGWARAKNILNTYSVKKLEKILCGGKK